MVIDYNTATQDELTPEALEFFREIKLKEVEALNIQAFEDAKQADSLLVEEQVAQLRADLQAKWANTDESYTIPQ